ncbi:hypothetical protein QTO34_007947 [Cnephaeus nilssonii]|uniref:Uncharacterized protein n=1 Tax=Cnephaeus nilssonii TaxID=3371016 RepID=A0AA40I9K0_CNENI|nr:hypothetical protein QTO34_007947 [Eptesicus nilssonii]
MPFRSGTRPFRSLWRLVHQRTGTQLPCDRKRKRTKGCRFKGKRKGKKAAQIGAAKGKVQFQGKKTTVNSDDEHNENGTFGAIKGAGESDKEELASKQQKTDNGKSCKRLLRRRALPLPPPLRRHLCGPAFAAPPLRPPRLHPLTTAAHAPPREVTGVRVENTLVSRYGEAVGLDPVSLVPVRVRPWAP